MAISMQANADPKILNCLITDVSSERSLQNLFSYKIISLVYLFAMQELAYFNIQWFLDTIWRQNSWLKSY